MKRARSSGPPSSPLLIGASCADLLTRQGGNALSQPHFVAAAEPPAAPSRIVTFAQELDNVLAGGVPLGEVTELVGLPGVGKTQLCLQLALDVQLPAALGGCEGECLFVDCEGALSLPRLQQMAEAVQAHIHRISRTSCPLSREEHAACVARGGEGNGGGGGGSGAVRR
jgi:RecA/RadA recombinase